MATLRRDAHRGELAGLAERHEDISDEFAHVDEALALSLAAASEQLRRWLGETSTSSAQGGLWP